MRSRVYITFGMGHYSYFCLGIMGKMKIKSDVSTTWAIPQTKHVHLIVVPNKAAHILQSRNNFVYRPSSVCSVSQDGERSIGRTEFLIIICETSRRTDGQTNCRQQMMLTVACQQSLSWARWIHPVLVPKLRVITRELIAQCSLTPQPTSNLDDLHSPVAQLFLSHILCCILGATPWWQETPLRADLIWLTDWLAGWLADWLTGWLTGWLGASGKTAGILLFFITQINPLISSGDYMYHQFTAQWSLYVPSVYSPVVTICTVSLQTSGHYMYRQFTAQ
jgi:hypothetical protein